MDENIIGFRGMSSEKAREVRAEGISAEKEFADLIGGKTHGSGKKKDVIDKRGDIHSVKSGEKKWQIFLYGYQRILNELDFAGAKFILECLNSFPENREEYLKNKGVYKNQLKIAMNNFKEFLFQENNKLLFLKKAFLNNGEVDFLTIKHNEKFHIFDGDEVIRLIDSSTLVVNSKAKFENQFERYRRW